MDQQPKGSTADELRKVAGNTLWVGVWQASNQLPALLALPFVARALGPTTLGTYAQMLVLGAYTLLILDFGFNLTATREASRRAHEPESLRLLASEVLTSKLILLGIVTAALAALLPMLDFSASHAAALVAVFASSALTGLTPYWLFMGIHRMRPLALANAVMKTLGAILIVLVAHSPADLLKIALINAIASAAVLLCSILALRRICWPLTPSPVNRALARMREAFPLFGANAAVNSYTYSAVLIVSLVLGSAAGGIFAIADRVRQFAVGLLGPISQAVYPWICRLSVGSQSAAHSHARRLVFRTMLTIAAGASIVLLVAARPIANLMGGPGFEHAADVIRAMSPIPLVVTLVSILSTQTMLPHGLSRDYLLIATGGAVAGVTMLVIMSLAMGVLGAGIASLITELFVLALCIVALARRNLLRGIL